MEERTRPVPHARPSTAGADDPAARPSGSSAEDSGGSSNVASDHVTSDHVADDASGATASSAAEAGPAPSQALVRSQFETFELATVLSHFDIGVIEAIKPFPRGSRKAPKLVLRTDTGAYLLKRRAHGRNDAYKVAFSHEIQLRLAQHQFPLPHLIGTRRDNNSMLQYSGHIYELFEYIKGTGYDSSLDATQDAGKILALFHKLLADHDSPYEPARGSYHASRSVTRSLNQAPTTLRGIHKDKETQQRIGQVTQYLHTAYNDAVERLQALGLEQWPEQIVHSDWHPGNMLFRGSRVVAVIDYDSARRYQRVIDVANGALQFSIIGKGNDPEQWPDYVDESRYKRFLRGYDSVPDCVLSRAELRAMPWLMIEALIAESAIPIAATGAFARMDGLAFLAMVERKVHWIQQHAETLTAMVDT